MGSTQLEGRTYIPKFSPSHKVRVIYEALRVNVLAWTDHHSLSRDNVDHGWLSRICMGDPYRDRETVGGSAEVDGEGPREMEEQGIGAVREG